jgi:hypothetical protein
MPTANAAMTSPIPHRTRRRAPGTADGDDPGGGGGGGGGEPGGEPGGGGGGSALLTAGHATGGDAESGAARAG